MDNFNIKEDGNTLYITHPAEKITIKAEKNRVLKDYNKGAIIIATLYRERLGFEQVCDYVVEAVEPETFIDAEIIHRAVHYFFTVGLKTSYYVKKVPLWSSLYTGELFATNEAVFVN
jgi:hypothetical protein